MPPSFVPPEPVVPVRLPPPALAALAVRALPEDDELFLPLAAEPVADEALDALARWAEPAPVSLDGLAPALPLFVAALAAVFADEPPEAVADFLLSLSAPPAAPMPDGPPDRLELDAPPVAEAFSPLLLASPGLPAFEALSRPALLVFVFGLDSSLVDFDLRVSDWPLAPDLEPALCLPPFDDAPAPDAVLPPESEPELVPDWADPEADCPAPPAWPLFGAADSDDLLAPLDLLLSSDGAEDLSRSALFWSRLS